MRQSSNPLLTIMLGILLVILVVAILTGCGGGVSLSEGKVISKEYDDADDNYISGYTIYGSESCSGGINGQPRICTSSPDIHIPGHWDHEPERYLLTLEASNPDKPDKPYHDTREVPESFYNDVKVGQWVNVKTLEITPQ